MLDTWNAIRTRRSIRKYTDEPVAPEKMELLLRAAMQAPSAADCRPWQFVAVDDPSILRALEPRMGGCEMLREAAAAILICAEPDREQFPGFWPQDCSCAAHNIQLMAHALGLGAVWIGLYPLAERMDPVRETFGVPSAAVPFAMISLGAPNEFLPPEDRYEASKVHRNQWNHE